MNAHEYLEDLLRKQAVDDYTLSVMRDTRDGIERVLRGAFGHGPRIYYAGSYGKKTMISAYHDLDIVVYFPAGGTDTLKTIYWAAYKALADAHYLVQQKDVAIHLPFQAGFTVDVVPGRAIDNTFYYANLYRSKADSRLQTSIKKHIETISESGLRGTMKLMKYWNVRNGLGVRSFALELLTIRALAGKQVRGYDNQLWTVLQFLRDNIETIRLQDPANSNNIITDLIPAGTKQRVAQQARTSLSAANWGQIIW